MFSTSFVDGAAPFWGVGWQFSSTSQQLTEDARLILLQIAVDLDPARVRPDRPQ